MKEDNTVQSIEREVSRTGGVEEPRDQPHPEEEFYRSILYEAPDGFVLVDGEERCRYLNRAFTRITGYTREDLPTITAWLEHAHPNPAYRQKIQDMWEGLLQGDRSTLVSSVVCGDGKLRDIEIRRSPLENCCSLLTVRDVTDQVLIEERLGQTTSELTAVIEAFPDLFLRLNADGTIIDSRAGRLAEVPVVPRTLLGRRIQDLFPAKTGDALLGAIQQTVRADAPAAPLEFSHTEQGEVRHYEARVVPLHETHVMAIVREITELKQAREELRRHREHLEDLVAERTAELEHANRQLEHLLYIIEKTERRAAEEWLDASIEQGTLEAAGDEVARITTDAAGAVVFANRAAGHLIGCTAEELVGRPIWPFLAGDDTREVLSTEVLSQGRPGECIEGAMLVRDDGLNQWARISADPIIDAAGAVIGMICTFKKM
ncbi:PAS domain S-box protein [Methanoculleus sp.]|uniref:PAS domain S-box protein n=1 Tax=Methanoculleus sp. TaxID=90427 RepID=UPI0025DB3A36|nr:PAS domain S-box protein [Methanoculleus sp.]